MIHLNLSIGYLWLPTKQAVITTLPITAIVVRTGAVGRIGIVFCIASFCNFYFIVAVGWSEAIGAAMSANTNVPPVRSTFFMCFTR